jgi:tRNA(Ile)-lysidine synthetase-like protein
MDELYRFWYQNENLWFRAKSSDDEMIYKKYDSLLSKSTTSLEYLHLKNTKEKMCYIILWDQIARHIARASHKDYLIEYHEKSLQLAMSILQSGEDKILEPKERTFLLLPLRHTKNKEYIKKAIEIVKTYREKFPLDPYYKRFYYASVRQLSSLVNEQVQENCFEQEESRNQYDYFKDILCESVIIDTFLDIPKKIDKKVDKDKWYHAYSMIPKDTKICISLSGGVDSMVCSYFAKKFGFDTIAIMINYCNRDTCSKEVEFVTWWCHQLQIPLYVRSITEVKRERNGDREFYEKITKEIRFAMYKKFPEYNVILGHNKDDTIENIFANITKLRSFDNLLGMKSFSIQEDVSIWRPLLNITKKEIIAFANTNNIPYLYDSTPKWSERGKCRDELIPFLDSYNPTLLQNIHKIADYMSESSQLIKREIIDNTEIRKLNKYEKISDNIEYVIEIENKKITMFSYWKQIWSRLIQEYNVSPISTKSLENFIVKLKDKDYEKTEIRRVEISKNNSIIIDKTKILLYKNA